MQILPPQEKFEKILKRLQESVVMGKAHLNIGRRLAETLTQDPVIADVAHVFWSTTAHLDAAQLLAFKLFDSRPGSMTLEYLLELSTDGVQFKNLTADQVLELVGTEGATIVTGCSFCTKASERVYITASGCEIEFGGTRGL